MWYISAYIMNVCSELFQGMFSSTEDHTVQSAKTHFQLHNHINSI